MNDIRVAAVQFQHRAGDKEANFTKIERFAEDAATKGVAIVAFPEMCLTGYWHVRNLTREGVEALAEPIPSGPSTARLLALSRRLGLTIGAGLIEEDGGKLYNSYVVAMPDGRFACHRKLHAFEGPYMSC